MMRAVTKFNFSTTIALISGASRYDAYTLNVLQTIRQVNPNVNFVGVIGSDHQKQLKQVYGCSSALDNNPYEVTRAYNTYRADYQDFILMPYRTYTIVKNIQMINHLTKLKFFEDLSVHHVDAVVTIGNFNLARRLGYALNDYCAANNKVRPYTAIFDRQISEREVEQESFLDFQYQFSAKSPDNAQKYVFPSLCVGYEGLYQAFQHLQQFRSNPNDDSFHLENFTYDVSQLVKKSRAQFRVARNISQDKYVIYFSPGKTVKEIKFSFTSLKNGLNAFFNKENIKNLKNDVFELVIALPADQHLVSEIKGKIGYIPQNHIKVSFVEEKDRFGALCASDFGILHNGEVAVEAAACQLPATVVDSMSNAQAYFEYLYNGHVSPLNVATNYHGYQDLCGSLTAIGEKVASIILENFQSPKLRFYYAKLYRDQIQKILSKSGTNPELRVSENGLLTGCKHLVEKAEIYHNGNFETPFKKERLRKQALLIN